MCLLPDERTRAAEYLRGLGWTGKQPLVIIHPGAGKIANRWPVEYFAEAAKQLLAEDQAQIFITWGSMEPDLGDKLLSLLDRPVMFGRFDDIRELAAVLATADLVLCNDTGVMHLAAAVGRPLVAPFGPTDPAEWKPVGDSFVAIRAGDFKTASVKPEQVVAAARKLLNRKS
jgi:ADP-heptose:LPS heptosyltransferase